MTWVSLSCRIIATALVVSLPACSSKGTDQNQTRREYPQSSEGKVSKKRAGSTALTSELLRPQAAPKLAPPCDCEELLSKEELRTILGVQASLTSEGFYNTCRYRLTGEPSVRAIVNVTYNSFYPVKRYEGQLRMAKMHANRRSGLRYEVFETDDVGARSYEYVSFVDEKPVFMQKCFLTKNQKYLISVQLKLRQLDAKSNLFYVPKIRHLTKITRIVEKNLTKHRCASG